MNQLSPDTIFEILKFARWEDIAKLCRSHPQFVQMCRSERGKILISQKRQEYREKQINDFLNYLDDHQLNLLSIMEGRSKVGTIPDITSRDLRNYMAMSKQLALDFVEHYPGKGNRIISQELYQFERDLNREYLLENYYLFILVKIFINQRLQTYRSSIPSV